MDDMLIVRMSDRSRERFTRNRRALPLGGNLGLIFAIPLTIVFAKLIDGEFPLYLGIGAAVGIAFFAFFGRFITPLRKKRPMAGIRHYDGLPFSSEDEDEEASEEESALEPSSS